MASASLKGIASGQISRAASMRAGFMSQTAATMSPADDSTALACSSPIAP